MKPKLVVFTVAAVSVYFALAILGIGGFREFFFHPALIALFVSTLLMVVASLASQGNVSSGEREDRGNRWVLLVFGLLGLLSGFLPAYTDRIGFWTLDGETVRWVGVVLFTAGGALRIWPVFILGRRFSGLVAIQPGHTLVTTGLYAFVRNPSYLGMIVTALGWSLAFRSVVGILLTALLLPPLVARIRSEEALLRSHFGSEYERYCAQTRWRLVPGIY